MLWMAAVTAVVPAVAQTPEIAVGTGRALSGDRLILETVFGEQSRIRLAGLVAPPPGATCPSPAENIPDWECGNGSRDALAAVIEGEELVCDLAAGQAADGSRAGECFVQTRNLNIWMLEVGRALLLPEWRGRISEYDRAELAARRSRAMLWAAIGAGQ